MSGETKTRMPFEHCELWLHRLAAEVRSWPGVTDAGVDAVDVQPLGMIDVRDAPQPKGLQLTINAESYERLHEALEPGGRQDQQCRPRLRQRGERGRADPHPRLGGAGPAGILTRSRLGDRETQGRVR